MLISPKKRRSNLPYVSRQHKPTQERFFQKFKIVIFYLVKGWQLFGDITALISIDAEMNFIANGTAS